MPEMIALRDLTIRTTLGHCIPVTANVPVHIPDIIIAEAMQLGLAPVSKGDLPKPDPKLPHIPVGLERQEVICAKIQEFVDRSVAGQTGYFTAGGQPHAVKLGEELGFEISANERTKIWDDLRAEGKVKR